MSEIQTFVLSLITGGSASALVVWLARNWISERLKNSIKHEYDAKLETLKSQLQLAAAERSIRYSKVFEETASTISKTYELLLRATDAVTAYTSLFESETGGTKAERRKIVAARLEEFGTYYRPRKPYLPKPTARQIDVLWQKLHGTSLEFMFKVEQGHDNPSDRKTVEDDPWIKAHNFMSKEVPPILDLLEDDFRRILGLMDAENK